MRTMMRRTGQVLLAVLLALVLVLPVGPGTVRAADGEATETLLTVTFGQSEARRMLEMMNEFRTGDEAYYWNETDTAYVSSQGAPLTYSYALEEIAMQRAAETALDFAHTRPDGTRCFTALAADGTRSWGENIAAGTASSRAEDAFRQWREDDQPYAGQGHRRNMLKTDFQAVGIGHVVVGGIHYWAQEFGYAADTAPETDPADEERAVAVTIADSMRTGVGDPVVDTESVSVAEGEDTALPAVTIPVRLQDTWPGGRSVPVKVLTGWTSGDPSVADVDGQMVSGLKAGQTVLTGTVMGKSVSVTVTVTGGSDPTPDPDPDPDPDPAPDPDPTPGPDPAPGPGLMMDSGCEGIPKLSPAEIRALLDAAPADGSPRTAAEVYDGAVPSFTSPFTTGTVKTDLLQRTVDRLNALRRIAGLPDVVLDLDLSAQAQYGTVLLGTEGVPFGHRPDRPESMEEEFYAQAVDATGSSNISGGRGILETPLGFMDDAAVNNLPTVGHRRWQLYPLLGRVGIGHVVEAPNTYRRYTVEKVFDTSGTAGDYSFISWPASGSFPCQLFAANVPWSVSLDPRDWSAPVEADVTVHLVRESDGRDWTFSGDYPASATGDYMNVNNDGYGIPRCIIFRPDPDSVGERYDGTWTVTIDGLKDRAGDPADLAWQVTFFDADALPDDGADTRIVSVRTTASGTDLTVTVEAQAADPGRFLLSAAAYGEDGKFLVCEVETVSLDGTASKTVLTLPGAADAGRIRAVLLTEDAAPAALPMDAGPTASLASDASDLFLTSDAPDLFLTADPPLR